MGRKKKHRRCKATRKMDHSECVCFLPSGHHGPHSCEFCYARAWVTPIKHLRKVKADG